MRPILAISRFVLSASLGYAVVWAYSDPNPPWMSDAVAESSEVERAAFRLPGVFSDLPLGGSAQAALPPGHEPSGDAAGSTLPRVTPPFRGLQTADIVLELARGHERLRLEAEQDGEGAWVVGYGRRLVQRPSGPITERDAESMLREDVERAEQAVRDAVVIPLNANELAALTEFARSIGPENFQHTLVSALLNAGDRAAAADAFLIWTKVRVEGALVDSPELVEQRRRERELFLSSAPSDGA